MESGTYQPAPGAETPLPPPLKEPNCERYMIRVERSGMPTDIFILEQEEGEPLARLIEKAMETAWNNFRAPGHARAIVTRRPDLDSPLTLREAAKAAGDQHLEELAQELLEMGIKRYGPAPMGAAIAQVLKGQ